MSSIAAEVKKFARAIAIANGHPEPDEWATTVADVYVAENPAEIWSDSPTTSQSLPPPPVLTDPVAQNAPVENTLQLETPAV